MIINILSFFSEIIFYLPTPIWVKIRKKLFEFLGGKAGSNLIFGYGSVSLGVKGISLGSNNRFSRFTAIVAENNGIIQTGDNLYVNSNTVISASDGGRVKIGNGVLIAQNVVIRASNHNYASIDRPIQEQGHTPGVIIIEDGVWIAANVVITSNVIIGEHSIIAAGSVVTKDLPSFGIYGGIPAELLKSRKL